MSSETIADELARAYASATQVAPIAARESGFDVAAGYAVLARLHAWREAQGWRPIGRKIGFTNVTIWERYGVDRPMWSHVWDRSVRFARDGEASIDLTGLMEPRIEPEVVLKLRTPLPASGDAARLIDAVEWIAAGFEIVHTPFPGWRFSAADCAAAFGLHGALAVGKPRVVMDDERDAIALRLATFEVQLRKGDEPVERGRGSNVLGSPLRALAHLRDLLASQPQFAPLAAGEIVTTGTLTDAWPVQRGESWTADYGTLGVEPVRVTFA
jgi:2-oxo-3-hexenedioate decarboxylase